jgi:hypothetical protein
MGYPVLQTFFRNKGGKWLPVPEKARKAMFELFRQDPTTTFFQVPFPGDGAMLEYRCWREHPEWSRVVDAETAEPHPSVCLTHYWSFASHGVYEHYDTQMACELEYTYRQLEEDDLALPGLVTLGKYQVHVEVGGQMTQQRLPKGAERDVLRTKIRSARLPVWRTIDVACAVAAVRASNLRRALWHTVSHARASVDADPMNGHI